MRSPEHTTRAAGPTPIRISRRTALLLAGAAIVALILLLRAAPVIVTVVLGGGILALVLSFPVRLLTRRISRWWAIAIVVVAFLLLVLVALLTLVPLLVRQLTELVLAAPGLAEQAEATALEVMEPLRASGLLPAEPSEVISRVRQGLANSAQTIAQSVLSGTVDLLSGAVGTLFQLFGMVFVGVYLLADIRRFKAAYLRAVPRRYRHDAQTLWEDLAHSQSRFLGGLLLSLAIQGVLAMVALWFLGVPYAFLLGLWTAVTAILPYIGAWLAGIPATILALFVSPLTAVLTALAYIAINQLEGNILTPRIQGEAVQVHPLLIFLAVLAGGEIAGLAGAALAVPAVAILRVLTAFVVERLRVERPH